MNKLVSNSTKSPLVTAIHTAVRGRARYQVLGLQGSIGLKHDLEGRLAREVGIRSIRASATSGNVLVLFEPTQTVAAIATLIQQMVTGFRDRFRHRESIRSDHSIAQAVSQTLCCRHLSKARRRKVP
jgi:P-type Ca2+ transporter type 2C